VKSVKYHRVRCSLASGMVWFAKERTPALVDLNTYLFALQVPYLQHQISWSEGPAYRKQFRIPDFKAFLVPTLRSRTETDRPTYSEVSTTKSNLNRQMKHTLEAIGGSLVSKLGLWIFDPVIDNALAAGNGGFRKNSPARDRRAPRAATAEQST